METISIIQDGNTYQADYQVIDDQVLITLPDGTVQTAFLATGIGATPMKPKHLAQVQLNSYLKSIKKSPK